MANFISIPVTSATAYVAGEKLVNANVIISVIATALTTIIIYTAGENVTLTIAGATGTNAIDAINAALTAAPGGVNILVDFPTGVTCTAIAVA
jgi:hypothetical protein